jgi:hypothetical protein
MVRFGAQNVSVLCLPQKFVFAERLVGRIVTRRFRFPFGVKRDDCWEAGWQQCFPYARLAGPIYSAAAWDAACRLDWTSVSKPEGFETLKEGPVQQ